MNRSIISAACLLSLSLLPLSSPGLDGGGRYAVLGVGATYCRTLSGHLESYRAMQRNRYGYSTSDQIRIVQHYDAIRAWMDGYITAYNAFRSSRVNAASQMSEPARLQWLENYCQINPKNTVNDAMLRLIRVL